VLPAHLIISLLAALCYAANRELHEIQAEYNTANFQQADFEMKTGASNAAFFGGLGALAPDIILFYSKRWTMPTLTFDPYMYISATILYVTLAAVVAAIYPFKQGNRAWKAFRLGVALPTIISTLATINRARTLIPKGISVPGSFHDLLAWF
jgi:hypothetical protein